MKPRPVILLGGAGALVALAVWLSYVSQLAAVPVARLAPPAGRLEPPLNRRCTVTVDPLLPRPVIAGEANITTGFSAPDVAVGILVRMDEDWVVLRDGCAENWIPSRKVIMVHYCD